MDVILFNMSLSSTICISFNLYAVEISDILSLEVVVASFDLAITLGLLFAYCYLSDWMTADLFEIGYVFYNSSWYRLETKRQRLLVLPIQRANRLVRLKSLGLFDCSTAVFLSVKCMQLMQKAEKLDYNNFLTFYRWSRLPLLILL